MITDQKNRILNEAERTFFLRGIKSVSMEQIAENLGISKRTLYENYESKDELILQVIRDAFKERTDFVQKRMKEKGDMNEFEFLFRLVVEMHNSLKAINPVFFEDLRKYYYRIDENSVLDLRGNFHQCIKEVCLSAQKKGYFFRDLDMDLLYTFITDMIADKLKYQRDGKYTEVQIHKNILGSLLRGTLTPKGQVLFDRYKRQWLSSMVKF
ncbi:MAG: TetR/AcrR family transcriptional regulator [Bacteroidales bacterium]